jgi:hypothetical protein
MGASLSQDTAYLPDEVINNYRRSDDRDLRFRLALASHQRFYKHFDPAKLVLTEDEFVEVFSPSFVDARLHFRHLDEKERGRVSSFEALAGCYLTSRNWDESSEKLLVTALFQVFDRSSKGSLSRVEMEILLRTSCQALTSLYRTKPVADYVLRDAVKKIFGDKKNGSGRRSGRASLADLLRWVRGGDEVQTFLSLFDRESLEGTTTVKAKRPTSKRGPDVKKSHSERSPEMLMAEIEVRTDLVWGLVTGAVRGAKDQATQNETAKKARELAEAAASEEARLEAEKRAAEAEAEAQRLAAEAEAKAQDASATRLAACVRGRNSRREIDAQKRAATRLAACERGRAARKDIQDQSNAATALQAQIKGRNARQELTEQKKAATALAAAERGRSARKEVKEQQHAATALQAQIKGRNARKEVADQKVAATKLQASIRGKNARKVGPTVGQARKLFEMLDRREKGMLAVSDIVKQLDERPECQYYLKGTGNPLLQELLGADDLEARLMRRPLSTKGVITKQEWDAAINEWAAAPDLAGIPDGDEDPLSPIVKRRKPVQPLKPPRELVMDDDLKAAVAKREALRREKRKSIVPSQPLDASTKSTLAAEAKQELGEDALKQAKDAFEAADVNSSNDLDREEVEKVLLSMGISSASELAEIFLSSDRMDFDGFCIMIAPETARKCREKLGVAPQQPSPTKRKVPRQKLTGRFSTSEPTDFSQTFRSTRTGLPMAPCLSPGGVQMPAVETPREAERPMEGAFTPGPAPAREAAPPSTEKSPGVAESTPAGFAGFRQDGLDGRLKEVDEECAAEVDGLHSLSAELAKMTGSLDDLKSTMTTFWQTRHEVIDEKERKTYNAAVTIQKLFRRFSVRLRMARWVAEEDDDDVASQLENVRVAVAQFCLANHVDFDRVEKKFADVNKSLKRATAEHVAADELLAGDSNASLDELAGSRATACRIREWQEAHARRSG